MMHASEHLQEHIAHVELARQRGAGAGSERKGRYEFMDPSVQAEFCRFYCEPNEALYELIGCRFDLH